MHRIFSRVKDHEALVQQGTEPIVAYRKKLSGNSFDEDKDEMDTYMTQNEPEVASIIEKEDDSDSDGDGDVLVGFGEQQDSNVVDLEHLDTEVQQMEQYMNKDSVTSDYEWAMEQLRQGGNPESSIEPAFPTKVAVRKVPEFHLKRQTLLFSATVTSVDNYAKQKKEQKWKLAGNVEIIETNNGGNRGKKTVKAVDALPTHVRQ